MERRDPTRDRLKAESRPNVICDELRVRAELVEAAERSRDHAAGVREMRENRPDFSMIKARRQVGHPQIAPRQEN